MKKTIKFTSIFIGIFVALLGFLYFNTGKNSVEKDLLNKQAVKTATVYKDFSSLNSLPVDYSYSTIFLSENTTFEIITNSGQITKSTVKGDGVDLPLISDIDPNDSVSLLITNCAVNKNGEILDVVVTIDNVVKYDNDYNVFFVLNEEKKYLTDQTKPSSSKTELTGYGDAIPFLLMAQKAKCDFTLTYYKAGTYNKEKKSGTYGGIDYINSFYYDIDTADWIGYTGKFLNADEGFSPTVGSSTIYYNKTNNDRLYETNNGIAAKTTEDDTDAIWYRNSAFMLTEDITNSTYKFTYGGTGCGMGYIFQSPYPYEIEEPVKTVDKSEATTKENITYNVSQYIPNNYYGNEINFDQIYTGLYSSTRFDTLVLKDTINSNLSYSASDIKITNELGSDVTNYFNITTSGQNITATANSSYFTKQEFYNHVYTMKIPTTIKDIGSLTTISNNAKTDYSFSGSSASTLTSNSVSTKIYYNLIVNHYLEGSTTPYVDPIITKKYNGDSYTTAPITITNYELITPGPTNSQGTISNHTTVNYYYQKKQATLIVKHLEYETNKELAPSETKNVYYGDEYKTEVSEKVTKNYIFKTKTNNYQGTVKEEIIEVIYYYEKKDSNLEPKITKTGTDKITNLKSNVDYKIEYEAKISDYLGKATIEIVDTLPSTIEESKSSLDGGIYDSNTKTITWIIEKENIDASTSTQTVNVNKSISLVYENLKPEERIITNTVKGKIKLDNNEKEVENKKNTFLEIKGKIIIHHYLVNTKRKIADDVITEGLVGDTYTSQEVNKSGYILVSYPENRTHKYINGTSEYIYEYSIVKSDTDEKTENPKTSTNISYKSIIILVIILILCRIVFKANKSKIIKI